MASQETRRGKAAGKNSCGLFEQRCTPSTPFSRYRCGKQGQCVGKELLKGDARFKLKKKKAGFRILRHSGVWQDSRNAQRKDSRDARRKESKVLETDTPSSGAATGFHHSARDAIHSRKIRIRGEVHPLPSKDHVSIEQVHDVRQQGRTTIWTCVGA